MWSGVYAKMPFNANKENVRRITASAFAGLSVLSLWLAYVAIRCHSYGRTPFRFMTDMLLRTLLIALPFCLVACTYGLFKNRLWAARCTIYVISMIFLIAVFL